MWLNKKSNVITNSEYEVQMSPESWVEFFDEIPSGCVALYKDDKVIISKLPVVEIDKCTQFKRLRNKLLSISDVGLLEDYPITFEQKEALIKLRDQLRNLCDYVNDDHTTLFDAIDCNVLVSLKLIDLNLYT